MTLHEAIVEVLERSGHAMSTSAIATEVNRVGHYHRGDGGPVPSSQISARVAKYPHLFTRSGGLIDLCRRGTTASAPRPVRPPSGDPPRVAAGKSTGLAPLDGHPFRDVGAIGQLLRHGLPTHAWLADCGVYALALPSLLTAVEFHDESRARSAGNVIAPWPVELLKQKWVSNTRIVYIGLAGARSMRSLRERLKDLIEHCAGRTSDRGPHSGGEIIWQLVGYESLLLRAMVTGGPPEPRETERKLLSAFVDLHGRLPFANRQR